MKTSPDGKCPYCEAEDYKTVVACHRDSMYDDVLECRKCGKKYDCYQTNYNHAVATKNR